PSRVYDHSRSRLGMTPGTYRNGGRGVRVGFTAVAAALGTALVAATERGLCAVAVGGDAGAREAGVRRGYPAAMVGRRARGARVPWGGAGRWGGWRGSRGRGTEAGAGGGGEGGGGGAER